MVSFLDFECDPVHELSGMRHSVGVGQPFAPSVRESEARQGSSLPWWGLECEGLCRGGLTLQSRVVLCHCRYKDNRGLPGHREAPAEVPAPGPAPGPRDGSRSQEYHLTLLGVPEPQHPGNGPPRLGLA